jgi:Flp pilus assembly protein TadG
MLPATRADWLRMMRGHRFRKRPARLRPKRRDRGSLSVELVIVTPGLVLLLLLVGAAGRVVGAQGHLDGAARDAARAASTAPSPQQASQAALQAAQADLGQSSWCTANSVQALLAGFPVAGQPVLPGQDVTATVTCDVNMSPFTLLGFHPAMVFTGQAVAPLDVFTCRAPAC